MIKIQKKKNSSQSKNNLKKKLIQITRLKYNKN